MNSDHKQQDFSTYPQFNIEFEKYTKNTFYYLHLNNSNNCVRNLNFSKQTGNKNNSNSCVPNLNSSKQIQIYAVHNSTVKIKTHDPLLVILIAIFVLYFLLRTRLGFWKILLVFSVIHYCKQMTLPCNFLSVLTNIDNRHFYSMPFLEWSDQACLLKTRLYTFIYEIDNKREEKYTKNNYTKNTNTKYLINKYHNFAILDFVFHFFGV